MDIVDIFTFLFALVMTLILAVMFAKYLKWTTEKPNEKIAIDGEEKGLNGIDLIHLTAIVSMLGLPIGMIGGFFESENLAKFGLMLTASGIVLTILILPLSSLDKPFREKEVIPALEPVQRVVSNPISINFDKKTTLLSLFVFIAGVFNIFFLIENNRLNRELANLANNKNAQMGYLRSDIRRLKEDIAQKDRKIGELEARHRRLDEAYRTLARAQISQPLNPIFKDNTAHQSEKIKRQETKKEVREVRELKRGTLIIHSHPTKKGE